MNPGEVREDAFPAKTKTATGAVKGVPTEVTSMSFADKFLVTITQGGRLSQWIQVPLIPSPAGGLDPFMHLPSSGLMPGAHLNPTTVFGPGTADIEARGHLYATHLAAMVSMRNPEDRRVLVVGLGMGKEVGGQEGFLDVMELVQRVL